MKIKAWVCIAAINTFDGYFLQDRTRILEFAGNLTIAMEI
jgi:hypothetical protein